jgi:hypothetical protein
MFRLAVTGSLALVLAAGFLMGQDDKKAPGRDGPPLPKERLPTNFGKLGLTDEQKQKVLKIHASFKTKIQALNDQVEQLKAEERAELDKVLSDTQRTRLNELRGREKGTAKGSKSRAKTEKNDKNDKTEKTDKAKTEKTDKVDK